MPHSALAITSRHHPLAMSTYMGIFSLAIMYSLGPASATSLILVVGDNVTDMWELILLLGSVLAMTGILLPAKKLSGALILESLGALLIGIELGIYSMLMLFRSASVPWGTVIMFTAVSIGCLFRAYMAKNDKSRLKRAITAMMPASPIPLGDPDK
jgi:hypothetical protein